MVYLVNVVFLQALWFATILGAAHDLLLPAFAWFLGFLFWHLVLGQYRREDTVIVVAATTAGCILDGLWVFLGWVEFASPSPLIGLAPWWIVMLWAGFALTVNHSLRALHDRLPLAAACAAISAPLSYFAASRLGAVAIMEPLALYVALSVSWAVLIPCLLLLARNVEKPQIIGQPL